MTSNHQQYIDLKIEEPSENYLFNSLLDFEAPDPAFDHLHFQEGYLKKSLNNFEDNHLQHSQIIDDMASYLNLRTASLSQISSYVDEFYPMVSSYKRSLILAIRKEKLRLKREHAKSRSAIQIDSFQQEPLSAQFGSQVKIEDSGVSLIYLDDESLQTRKKKKNRMSAQNSRDRKKQYIKQIEAENQSMRKRITELQQKSVTVSNKDFLKVLLCLGITCLVQLEKCSVDMKSIIPEGAITNRNGELKINPSELNLSNLQHLVPVKYQESLSEIASQLNDKVAAQTESFIEFMEQSSQSEKNSLEISTRVKAQRKANNYFQLFY